MTNALVLLVILAVPVLIVLLLKYLPGRPADVPATAEGRFGDLPTYFAGLQASADPSGFLSISLKGTLDFFQFKKVGDLLELDFPVINERQRSKEAEFREACLALGLAPRESKGSDGSRFLDAWVTGAPGEVASLTNELFRRVFAAPQSARLEIAWYAFSLPAS